MPDYDFMNLSPYEFEILSRDLLSKYFNIRIESFAPGRDGGVDLRYYYSKKKQLFVQCKRLKDFSSLKSNLKKELKKISNLNPDRYLLTTSVDLTKANKDEIISLLDPFIKSPDDIFGRSDLNQLLSNYPDVERNHFKLWLSSSGVLDRILHSQTYNFSSFELDRITENLKFYVTNESFDKALELLQENRVIIISGEPGTGKTTLAQMLVLKLLGSSDSSLIALQSSISEGYKLYKEGESQIFLFDDFLGRNFLNSNLERNEDADIIRFVDKIKSGKNKFLIFTTREYILTQAYTRYEKLDQNQKSVKKYILDIAVYTKPVKAQILYNHLYFSSLTEEILSGFVDAKHYNEVINHRNYNPRLISLIVSNYRSESGTSADFFKYFSDKLNNPKDIWLHPFTADISKLSQISLLIMLTCGDPISYFDLLEAVKKFFSMNSNYNILINQHEYDRSLRELENTFINIAKDNSNALILTFRNPSVSDFLLNHLSNYVDVQKEILASAKFLNQFSSVFSFSVNSAPQFRGTSVSNPIELTSDLTQIVRNNILVNYEDLAFSSSDKIFFNIWNDSKIFKSDSISKLARTLVISKMILTPDLILLFTEIFESFVSKDVLNRNNLSQFMFILGFFKGHNIQVRDLISIIHRVFEQIDSLAELNYFKEFELFYSDEFDNFKRTKLDLNRRIKEIINDEVESTDSDSIDNLIDQLSSLDGSLGLDLSELVTKLEEKQKEYLNEQEDQFSNKLNNTLSKSALDQNFIDNLFKSLAK
jgi:DNA polymerase III delta prime subunit